ncbi:MAG TPA: hypothetical protein ENN39_03420 [Desulfonatronum sp.]|nr:hypothetical protein [Desulfonatronum sp.]
MAQRAAVTTAGGAFSDLGDASHANTNKMISQHIIPMASTKAKARVLKDTTNIGITALEELCEDAETLPDHGLHEDKGRASQPQSKPNVVQMPTPQAAPQVQTWHGTTIAYILNVLRELGQVGQVGTYGLYLER